MPSVKRISYCAQFNTSYIHTIGRSTFKLILLIFSISVCFAENNLHKKSTEFASALEMSYQYLYYPIFAKYYPHTASVLAAYIINKKTKEINLFLDVQKAKENIKNIKKIDNDFALNHTLKAIQRDCQFEVNNRRPSVDESGRCIGAILALYFFDSVESDKKILAFMDTIAPPIKTMIFSYDYGWSSNRKLTFEWINFVDQQPDNILNVTQKENLLNKLKLKYIDDYILGLYP